MPTIPHKTLDELRWPSLLAALEKEARTTVGRELSGALPFLETRAGIERHLARVAESRRLAAQALEVPVAGMPDVREHLARAAREGTLEAPALLACAQFIRTAVRVRRFLTTRRALAPMLAGEAEGLSDFEPLAAELERAIEPAGTLADHASPLLAELRDRARGLHRAVKGRIDEMLHDLELDEVLRDKYYTIRDERYVVPVVTQHKARLPGIVHNASQSGQTLFVEPQQLVELGNQLTIVQAMAQEEELRILRDLTEAIGRRAGELSRDLELLGELDRVGACGRLADLLGAAEPVLVEGTEPFVLRGLKHPLLVLRGIPVVANDVALGEDRKGLIVSGPNAGGKTITLSAIGLVSLMARAGLPVPCREGSKVPLYEHVFTAIGDEGDLSKDLSTFTAHLTALRDIAAATAPGTLVCIDEMAADTDPREGAAIASAMLERLVEHGAHVVITTHLDEVKAKGLTDPRFVSASVGFDLARMAPTYVLRMNQVGASSAIEIAARVGLPAEVCERARVLLGGAGGALGRAVEALEREREESARLARALDEERAMLAAARAEWDRQRRLLQQKTHELEAGLHLELVKQIDTAREEVRRTVSRLQADQTMKAAIETQKALETQRAREEQEAARAAAKAAALKGDEAARVAPEELKAGQRVTVAGLGREGEIVQLEGDVALVAVGPMKTRVPVADLVPLTGRLKYVPRMKRSQAERDVAVERAKAAPVPASSGRIDLRGMRAEDALRELRERLDDAFQSDARELLVVHGHGTGALKKTVREELESSAYVETFRPGEAHEGGDGVTVLSLRAR